MILSTGFFRQKSKSLIGMATMLVEQHGGAGAGRHGRAGRSCPASAARPPTSCSATRSACPACPSIATCCASPIGSAWCKNDDPVKVEAQLCEMLPPERWTRASDALILHGRRICRPKPLCPRCNVAARLRFLSHWLHDQAGRSAERPRRPRSRGQARGEEGRAQGRARSAMTRDAFRELVEEAIDTIPSASRARCATSRFVIEDEPSDELLDEMEIEDGDTLLGLYQGTPLTERQLGPRQPAARSHHAVSAPDRGRRRRRRGRDRRRDRRDADSRARSLLRHERRRDRWRSKSDTGAGEADSTTSRRR